MASVLVTGASRGIGYATALAFARAGDTVHAAMRSPDRAPALAEAARRDDLPIHVRAMDVDSDESVRDACGAIIAEHGAPDVLVNNAGISRMGTTEEIDLADVRAVFETNVFGVLRCTQALLPSMRERGSGCIVNVSSIAGTIVSSPLGAYAASKFALEAFSEALAQEGRGFGIRVAVVQPGIIDTDMPREIATPNRPTRYPHAARLAAEFGHALRNDPTPPELVASAIVEIAHSGSATLRHPVGPGAAEFIAWRVALTDEEWIAWCDTEPSERERPT
jgi:NAD(P)-dependent dehydrogenase (short-subunit alcohol dehydrogenase family)